MATRILKILIKKNIFLDFDNENILDFENENLWDIEMKTFDILMKKILMILNARKYSKLWHHNLQDFHDQIFKKDSSFISLPVQIRGD